MFKFDMLFGRLSQPIAFQHFADVVLPRKGMTASVLS